jgi:hypothetical protein
MVQIGELLEVVHVKLGDVDSLPYREPDVTPVDRYAQRQVSVVNERPIRTVADRAGTGTTP